MVDSKYVMKNIYKFKPMDKQLIRPGTVVLSREKSCRQSQDYKNYKNAWVPKDDLRNDVIQEDQDSNQQTEVLYKNFTESKNNTYLTKSDLARDQDKVKTNISRNIRRLKNIVSGQFYSTNQQFSAQNSDKQKAIKES